MAGGVANRRGIVGTVNTDAFFVKRDPHHADGISRAGSEQAKIAAARSVPEHFLVPTKRRHFGDSAYLPFADRRGGMRGADCDRIGRDELFAFAHLENVCFRVDPNGDISGCACTFAWIWSLRSGLIFHFVNRLRAELAAWLNSLDGSELKRFDVRHHDLITRFDSFHLVRV